jgi:aminotransferase EvaB
MTYYPETESIVTDNLEPNRTFEQHDEVPFIDLRRQYQQYRYEIKLALNRVLASGYYTSGPESENFELEFAAHYQVPYCIGVSSGIESLVIGLKALGVKDGDGVITVANAGMHSTSAIRVIGAIPQFVDVDPITMTMSSDGLADAINFRTRAVVVTHLYGRVADIRKLKAIADQHNLPLVEDCFQANGAQLDGKRVGTWGEIGCFCFSPTRTLGAFGEAGALITRHKKIFDAVHELRRSGSNWNLNPQNLLENSSLMNELQAAVLRAKLPMLAEWNLRRRLVAQTYDIHLDSSNSDLKYDYQSNGSVFQLFVIRTSKRDRVQKHLARMGIGSEIHYPIPDHRLIAGLNSGYPRVRLPETEKACAEVLSLPCYPELTTWEIEKICSTVNDVLVDI